MAKSGPPAAGGGGVTLSLASIKLPQFWQNAPAAWFRTVEAQFVIRAVTDPVDKYYVVMAALSELVSSVLYEELMADSYDLLKALSWPPTRSNPIKWWTNLSIWNSYVAASRQS
jgi:hypothetical protein